MAKTNKAVAASTATNAMKAQLATIKPVAKAEAQPSGMSFLEGTAFVIGSVPSKALGFADTIKTSFQYHEAVRKGQL